MAGLLRIKFQNASSFFGCHTGINSTMNKFADDTQGKKVKKDKANYKVTCRYCRGQLSQMSSVISQAKLFWCEWKVSTIWYQNTEVTKMRIDAQYI